MLGESAIPLEEMRRCEKQDYKCAECGGRLIVAWMDGWMLRCVNDLNHSKITRHDKAREALKQLERRELNMDSTALTKMDEGTMLARIDQARFPQELKPAERKTLALAAISYGFDPLMNEISIFQGRPYISIDGRYRKAQETGYLDGVETRPASQQERTDWQIPDGDFFLRAEVFVKGTTRPFVGWGRVRASETAGGKGFKPVETNPQRMAEKRAEAQALRKAFHIPLPSFEDIGTPEDGYDLPNRDREIAGRIIDVTVDKPQADDVSAETENIDTSKYAPAEDIDTWTDLFRVCAAQWPDLNTSTKVIGELGHNNQVEMKAEFKSAAEAYRRILAVRGEGG